MLEAENLLGMGEPLLAYNALQSALAEHVQSLKRHVKILSEKSYETLPGVKTVGVEITWDPPWGISYNLDYLNAPVLVAVGLLVG